MKIAHVTIYPPKGEKHIDSSGVASYSKNLTSHLGEEGDEQVVICNMSGTPEAYQEDGITVRRVFARTPRFALQIHRALRQEAPDVVHIQQELALYGNIFTAYLLQWLVFAWRQKAVITLHGVVDPAAIDAAFVRENNSRLPVWLVRLAFRAIYTPLMKWPRTVIVHEQLFKNIMVKSYGITPEKIAIIPHGVESFPITAKAAARRTLSLSPGSQLVFFMGYATGYKGIDLLIEGFAAYAKRHAEAFLLIGAGKHPKLQNDPAYLKEYSRLQQKAATLLPAAQYEWRGFIREDEISTYYSASDVSVYPYTTAMSSSGPMAFAIGHEKPFLVSEAFGAVFKDYPELVFERTGEGLAKRLEDFFTRPQHYQLISHALKKERTWPHVAAETLQAYRDGNEQKGAYEAEESITSR